MKAFSDCIRVIVIALCAAGISTFASSCGQASAQNAGAVGESATWTIFCTPGDRQHVLLLNTATGATFRLLEASDGTVSWSKVELKEAGSSEQRESHWELPPPYVLIRIEKLRAATSVRIDDGKVVIEVAENYQDPVSMFEPGDVIQRVDGKVPKDFHDFANLFVRGIDAGVARVTVTRNGRQVNLSWVKQPMPSELDG